MDDRRIIPEGGENPYAAHPGFNESACPLRMTVTPARGGGTSRHGFACYYTGGHCVPGGQCAAWRVEVVQSTAIEVPCE